MRRSSAPSKIGAKFTPPTFGLVSSQARNNNFIDSKVMAPIENAARSTKSILGLIAKAKETTELKPADLDAAEQCNGDLEPQQSLTVLSENVQNQQTPQPPNSNKRLFNVVYGKPTKKKHKTWEGDGILEIGEKSLTLKDCEGKVVGQGSGKKNSELEEGSRLFVGSKEVEIIDAVSSKNVVNNKRSLEPDSPQLSRLKKPKVAGTLSTLGGLKRPPISISQPYTPLVMPEPDLDHQWQFNKGGATVSSVAVDPSLVRVLRPHQREGVTFLYRCITGLRDLQYQGAILADEMGLGKTLQCITLIWTLLRHGLYGNSPLLRKVLIVTPSSLTKNWHQEFLRWLGGDRIHIFVVDQKKKPKNFLQQPNIPVMIISYEMFVRCFDDIATVPFDLIVCDEGHRLKNNSIRASTLLSQLPCQRRVLLTGTPVQNDLQEFYALVNFVNPNILGTYSEFRKNYEESIVASRQPDIDNDVKQVGESKGQELSSRTAGFVLRRTHAILDKYLPGKHEYVVFCKPSKLQMELFQSAISCWGDEERNVSHLAVITALKKISNHPVLLRERDPDKKNDYFDQFLAEELSHLSEDKVMIEDASKLSVVTALLHTVSQTTEKVVLVSYFTQTLDLLAALCEQYGLKHCRLDGNTPTTGRVAIVNEFNSPYSINTVFLLSARAGGLGLNLTGASRLVMFDSDWNPASDLQAMARIWRDGQKNSVHIYRLLTTGSIEEKIYQRQLSKAGLNEAVVDPTHTSTVRLSDEELKDLFSVEEQTDCLTHSMLPCHCEGLGDIPQPLIQQSHTRQCQLLAPQTQGQTLRINQLFQWEHHRQPLSLEMLKAMGLQEAAQFITFVFRNVLEITPPKN